MKVVGDHLAGVASKERDPVRFDLFSRSAFNRYYYSAFLKVRTALSKIDSKWLAVRHKAMPAVLKGEVIERVLRQASKYEKHGVLNPSQASNIRRLARASAIELSSLMDLAREVREIADYEPETRVEGEATSARLAGCTIAAASGWEDRVDNHVRGLLKAYDRLRLL